MENISEREGSASTATGSPQAIYQALGNEPSVGDVNARGNSMMSHRAFDV